MKFIILSAIVACLLAACGNSDEEKKKEYIETAKKELTILNNQYDSSLISADTIRIGKMYASEFIYTTSEGQVRNKSQQLNTIASGGLKMEFGKSDDVNIAVYDSAAVVTGRFMGKGIFKENIVDIKERYTTLWVRKEGQWVLVSEHSSPIQ